jgi:hypothetical protein
MMKTFGPDFNASRRSAAEIVQQVRQKEIAMSDQKQILADVGTKNFAFPLGGIDDAKIARDAQKLHPPREMNQRDLEQYIRDEPGLRERIASSQLTKQHCAKQVRELNAKIKECEDKIGKCNDLLKKNRTAVVADALHNHQSALEKLQDNRAQWTVRGDGAARIAVATQKILDSWPWADITRLLEERKALAEVL